MPQAKLRKIQVQTERERCAALVRAAASESLSGLEKALLIRIENTISGGNEPESFLDQLGGEDRTSHNPPGSEQEERARCVRCIETNYPADASSGLTVALDGLLKLFKNQDA